MSQIDALGEPDLQLVRFNSRFIFIEKSALFANPVYWLSAVVLLFSVSPRSSAHICR